jgi:hypothetical protein
MDILDVLRSRIIEEFPEITGEELESRVQFAIDMLRFNNYRNY